MFNCCKISLVEAEKYESERFLPQKKHEKESL